jgi:DNA-binding FadR family transcriptional regulator
VFFSYTSMMPADEKPDPEVYLARIRAEHGAIIAAIKEQSPERAREAMRVHLERAKDEYHEVADRLHSVGKNV